MIKYILIILLILETQNVLCRLTQEEKELVSGRIEHVIVLLEENRSFDNMLGWLKDEVPELDGLDGTQSAVMMPGQPDGPRILPGKTAPFVARMDPGHAYEVMTEKVNGQPWDNIPVDGFNNAKMDGFYWYERKRDWVVDNFNSFTPDKVPIITTLAKEYAVFDKWYSAVPTCTFPNRQFAHCASSSGVVNNVWTDEGYPAGTIYTELNKVNATWKVYYYDVAYVLLMSEMRTPEMKANIFPIEEFFLDCERGTLPNYAYINPRMAPTKVVPANEQHPDHDVRVGEQLMADVYTAIRYSKHWNKSLTLITYDENGGFWDHVSPPTGVPQPDNYTDELHDFHFDRLGVRIPAVAISPWIKKGTIIHEPQHGPQEDSQYELSSIPATLHQIFRTKNFLNKRDAWAATFEDVVLTSPRLREDCLKKLPPIPWGTTTLEEIAQHEFNLEMTDLQLNFITLLHQAMGVKSKAEHYTMTQGESGDYIRKMMELYLSPEWDE